MTGLSESLADWSYKLGVLIVRRRMYLVHIVILWYVCTLSDNCILLTTFHIPFMTFNIYLTISNEAINPDINSAMIAMLMIVWCHTLYPLCPPVMPSVMLSPCTFVCPYWQLDLYWSKSSRNNEKRDQGAYFLPCLPPMMDVRWRVIMVIYWSQSVTASKPYLRPTQKATNSLPNLDPTRQKYPTTAVIRRMDDSH